MPWGVALLGLPYARVVTEKSTTKKASGESVGLRFTSVGGRGWKVAKMWTR